MCQFIFNVKILFQKPIEDREFIIKVIEAKVIAIKAKDQELSGGFHNFVLILIVVSFSLGNVCNFLINSEVVLLVRLNLVLLFGRLTTRSKASSTFPETLPPLGRTSIEKSLVRGDCWEQTTNEDCK